MPSPALRTWIVLLLPVLAVAFVPRAWAEEPRLVTQVGHAGNVTAVALSPDGRLVATGGADNRIVLWQRSSGLELRSLSGHQGQVDRLAFSPDGRGLLSASTYDGRVRLWDVATGAVTEKLDVEAFGVVFEPTFLGGEAHLLAPGDDVDGDHQTVELLRVADGAVRGRMRAPLGPRRPAFPDAPRALLSTAVPSPDGTRVVGALGDGVIRVWDVASGREVRQAARHAGPVWTAAWSGDGRWIATVAKDGLVVVEEATTGRIRSTLEGNPEGSHVLAFSADGSVLAVGVPDEPESRFIFWDVAAQRTTASLILPSNHTAPLAVSPDGSRVLMGGGAAVEERDTKTGALVRSFAGLTAGIDLLAFSADGRRLMTRAAAPVVRGDATDEPARAIRVLDLEGRREVGRYEPGVPGWSPVAFSPDGRRVLFAFDNTLYEWLVDTGETRECATLRRTMAGDLGYLASGGRWVHTTSFEGMSRLLYEQEADGGLSALPVANVHSVAFSGDGTRILTADGSGGRLRLWESATKRSLRTIEGATEEGAWLQHLLLSTDGRVAVTLTHRDEAPSGSTLRIWDLEAGRVVAERDGPGVRYLGAELSPDGRSILLVEGPEYFQDLVQMPSSTVRMLDASTAEDRGEIGGFTVGLTAARYAPSGDVVLFGEDGSIRFLNGRTRQERCRYVRLRDGSWVAVRPDGRFDASDPGRIHGLHWVAPDAPFDPLPLEVFMRAYYEPQLLERTLGGEVFAAVPDLGTLNRLQPRVTITSVGPVSNETDAVRVVVDVENVRAGGIESGVEDLRLFRDDQLVAWQETVSLANDRARVVFDDVRLPHDGRKEIELAAYAFNADGVKSVTHRVARALPESFPRRQGRAYLVCVGVDVFETPAWNLSFAAGDAHALAGSLWAKLAFTEMFDEVVRVVLTSEVTEEGERVDRARRADVETVLRLLAGASVEEAAVARLPGAEKLSAARPEDLVVLTFSTHGAGGAGGFHLFPSDVGRGAARVDDALLEHCLSTETLSALLRPVDAGEIILVVDACQAAASVETEGFKPGPMGDRGLGQLAWDKRMRVLAASQAADVALESDVLRHGLLTYALVVEGLGEERADFAPPDGLLYLDEWLAWGLHRVPGLAEELRRGTRLAAGERGPLRVRRRAAARRVVQQPSLFDFARAKSRVILQ